MILAQDFHLKNKDKFSISNKIWLQNEYDEEYIHNLKNQLGISDFLASILSQKVTTVEEAYHFLEPKIKNLLPDPFHLLDMEKAVNRLMLAIQMKQKVCIFADYDVDGATSSALLKRVFDQIGLEADIYVPDRLEEGYGPSISGFSKIKDAGANLIITVDCGSLAHEPIKYAKECGIDVIVIDHHISSDELPDAIAVVNPNRLDETSEYRYLAAVGVSFLFVTAILAKMKENQISTPNLISELDLVALGTVCDVMPLIGLNRCFVSQGLKIMSKRGNVGINALSDISRLDEAPKSYHLGFVLGPRINAGGRVGKANLGARLLSSYSINEANKIASELDSYNNERKSIELSMLQEAIQIAESQQHKNLLFIAKQGWHPGVIGIIAGKIKDMYHKPVSIIGINDGICKASCRSINGFDFGAKILEAKHHGIIEIGGGHAMAAGFTATENQLPQLEKFLNDAFDKIAQDSIFKERIGYYARDISLSGVNLELAREITKLEPFGQGNLEPIFKISDLYIIKSEVIAEKHIRCLLSSKAQYKNSQDKNYFINAICFSPNEELINILLHPKPSMEVIGSIKINVWQSRETVQIQIKDVLISSNVILD
jgi:single-stranded-DNA-specific exonuclease